MLEKATQSNPVIQVGRVGAPFSVKGWLKVESFLDEQDFLDVVKSCSVVLNAKVQNFVIEAIRKHGNAFIAKFEGVNDRTQARAIVNSIFMIERSSLPEPSQDEIYWHDLQGMQVVNEHEEYLGEISHLFDTSANSVMVVKNNIKEHYIPFVKDVYVLNIDETKRIITVHWEQDYCA